MGRDHQSVPPTEGLQPYGKSQSAAPVVLICFRWRPLVYKVRRQLSSLQQTSRQGFASVEFLVQQAYIGLYGEEDESQTT
eukprot:2863377-Lingulodinium_polyedra.AAC.1